MRSQYIELNVYNNIMLVKQFTKSVLTNWNVANSHNITIME